MEINRFKDVPQSIADAEGEGDRTLAHWRKVHSELYAPHLKQWRIDNLDEAEVITEHFELVFRDDMKSE